MEHVIESLGADWEAFLRFAPNLLYGALVLLLFWLIGSIAGRGLNSVFQRSDRFRTNERFLRLLVRLSVTTVGVLLALSVMGFAGVAASLLATGGVFAVVLGFAFREIGENFLAGFFLSFSRPFELGDLIATGDLTGTVRTIELRYVHIRTSDGCDVYVPSAQIFRESLFNYTQDGLRRFSFTVGVAYHDSPEQVLEVLRAAIVATPDVLPEPAASVALKEFSESFVTYEVFYWIDVTSMSRGAGEVRNDAKVRCWRALQEAGLTFSTDVTTGIDLKTVPESLAR